MSDLMNQNHKQNCGCKSGDEGCGCGPEGHEHKNGEGCGCGHDHDHEHHDHAKIFLTTETGDELECDVLGIFDMEGQEYIALLPIESETAYLYRYSEEEEEPALDQIESEEEYAKVSAYFMELVEAEEE